MHKNILAGRCEYFKALFSSNMLEARSSKIIEPEYSYASMRAILQFIYTDEAPALENIAVELLVASNKYMLERLKNLCEDYLAQTMTLENVIDILSLAELHVASELKSLALKFAVKHFEAVIKLPAFKSLSKRVIVEMLQLK